MKLLSKVNFKVKLKLYLLNILYLVVINDDILDQFDQDILKKHYICKK